MDEIWIENSEVSKSPLHKRSGYHQHTSRSMDGDTSGSDEDQLDCLVKLLKSVGETEDIMRHDET